MPPSFCFGSLAAFWQYITHGNVGLAGKEKAPANYRGLCVLFSGWVLAPSPAGYLRTSSCAYAAFPFLALASLHQASPAL